jgi:hypothetical protein
MPKEEKLAFLGITSICDHKTERNNPSVCVAAQENNAMFLDVKPKTMIDKTNHWY